MKNAHAAAFETGVEAFVQMIYIQKYALSTLNLVTADESDGSALVSQKHWISEAKQFALHGSGSSYRIVVGHSTCSAHGDG